MARADLLIELIKSAGSGDQTAVRKISEALIQEEKSKGHRILADRLNKAMRPNGVLKRHYVLKQKASNNNHKNFIFEITPERNLSSLVLTEQIQDQIRGVIEPSKRPRFGEDLTSIFRSIRGKLKD